ncbi:hypothetical protein Btru_008585 [Bulinus truncatus]|nr:hypothetical protein Btru_008585 [Bulinus truncatus]
MATLAAVTMATLAAVTIRAIKSFSSPSPLTRSMSSSSNITINTLKWNIEERQVKGRQLANLVSDKMTECIRFMHIMIPEIFCIWMLQTHIEELKMTYIVAISTSEFETQECLESPQLSRLQFHLTVRCHANLADIPPPAHTTSPQRLSSHCQSGPQTSLSQNGSKSPGTIIKEYIFKLSSDHQTIFGSTIENFIQCTLESNETNPQYVMRNVRQFMTGIKNYLVKHGEGELEDLIERERNKLSPTEILNIDAIIEQALHVCVLKPLKFHIYRLFVEKYSKNSALEQLSKNIKYARTKSAQDIGVKPCKLPDSSDMEDIRKYLDRMQKSYSPLQKLQNLLKATSRIYILSSNADICYCPLRLVSAEIEADFMWGLLQPSLLTGEGGYYLTTLSSAVLILKNFQETHQMAPNLLEEEVRRKVYNNNGGFDYLVNKYKYGEVQCKSVIA